MNKLHHLNDMFKSNNNDEGEISIPDNFSIKQIVITLCDIFYYHLPTISLTQWD